MDQLRIILEGLALVLSVVVIVAAVVAARRLGRLSAASLSTRLFLRAPHVRRFIVVFAVSVVMFITMPIVVLGYLLTENDSLEPVHDGAHILFLGVTIIGLVALIRATERTATWQDVLAAQQQPRLRPRPSHGAPRWNGSDPPPDPGVTFRPLAPRSRRRR